MDALKSDDIRGALVMSDIPVHVQRSFEQRWAAKLASSGTAPELGGPIWLLTVLAGCEMRAVAGCASGAIGASASWPEALANNPAEVLPSFSRRGAQPCPSLFWVKPGGAGDGKSLPVYPSKPTFR
jgi:hypothetical protein